MFDELCECFPLSNVAWLSVCENNPLSWQHLELFGISMRPPLSNNSSECNPVLALEALNCVVTSNDQLKLYISHYNVFNGISFIYFRKFPLHQVCIPSLKLPLNLAVSLLIPLLFYLVSLLPT